ncbi:uncharacterized protein LOC115890804 isoform X3 [Sitophilus oryzae]|uniref:Uncharacterized protein LOC115890804 isoform X2 n=1 Tax=Sitophilus oryzae TaxID=7048 RepID=A0A6J2YUZ8_SITOR|nr:uncharacterized protein LOC115890804 isoform X2 [Sitophilus oryzae]XP_030767012.1 uncharacterized protein LOC115890804 isoform X3 [Sitophilus oryzae]
MTEMLKNVSNGKWKKFILLCFIATTVFLTISYYDTGKFLAFQVLVTTETSGGKENITSETNSTQASFLINKTEFVTLKEALRLKERHVTQSDRSETNSQCQNKSGVEQLFTTTVKQPPVNISDDTRYIVSSSKCKILNLETFSPDAVKYYKKLKYKACSQNKLLTYVVKENNTATVKIDGNVIDPAVIRCCYSNVSRKKNEKDPDGSIKITDCKHFKNNVTITKDAILIKCHKIHSKEKIYENVHASVLIRDDVQRKINDFNGTIKPLSVIFIGIDSISRLNFERSMPETYKYVEDNNWISLKGYNKMDDNTFPNLMAILTGFNQTTAYKICNPRSIGYLDKCPMLWYDYRNFGYVTGYAEDEASISTFNYKKKGFVQPPADYYFRPYVMASEKLQKVTINGMTYCTGPETAGERILNLVEDFAVTFKQNPHFGFFWMNSFSHNNVNSPSMMDSKTKQLLANLEANDVYNNTLIIFLSDHGMRFGDIRLTPTGWQEERLPFIYFSFPNWFKEKYPEQYLNFKSNTNKLTTPYDLYITLQHILVLSGFNYTIKNSDACPECLSLFEKVPSERSCEEAGIVDHWCTCAGYVEKKLEPEEQEKLKKFFLEEIQKIIQSRDGNDKCIRYSVESISTRISQKFSYKTNSYALVYLRTNPKAVFETTISYEGDIMSSNLTLGDISRLDFYNTHSKCVSDDYLKKYCFCKN